MQSRPPDEPWSESVALGRFLLDSASIGWIDDFASLVAEQLERQLPATFEVEVIESGFIVRITRGTRWIAVHTGSLLTDEWRTVLGERLERTEVTVSALLNHVAELAINDLGEMELRERIDGLHTHIDGDKVHGRLDLRSCSLHVHMVIAVPPDAPSPQSWPST